MQPFPDISSRTREGDLPGNPGAYDAPVILPGRHCGDEGDDILARLCEFKG